MYTQTHRLSTPLLNSEAKPQLYICNHTRAVIFFIVIIEMFSRRNRIGCLYTIQCYAVFFSITIIFNLRISWPSSNKKLIRTIYCYRVSRTICANSIIIYLFFPQFVSFCLFLFFFFLQAGFIKTIIQWKPFFFYIIKTPARSTVRLYAISDFEKIP